MSLLRGAVASFVSVLLGGALGGALGGVMMACARHAPAQQDATPAPAASTVGRAELACTRDGAFASVLDVPEASAAPLVPFAGGPALVVVSDSGNSGEILVWPLATDGPASRRALALDAAASDDLEGAAFARGRLYTLTSSGAVRSFTPSGDELRADGAAYRLGEPPASCADLRKVNCDRNYESLCLRPSPVAGAPAGWAIAKATSTMYAVAIGADGKLSIDASRAPVTLPIAARTISDCNFAPGGELLVATNVFDGNRVFVIDEATFEPRFVDVAGVPNLEAVAVDPRGRLWLFSDTGGRPSQVARYTCTGFRAAPGAPDGSR